MDALAKKRLKTLQLTDWASFVEDVNYNFSVLLSSPLFVGVQGEDGAAGATGPAGIRGSKWMFANIDTFRTIFPNDLLEGEYKITATYLTNKLQSGDTRAKLLQALNAGAVLVDGDVIVSNSKILVVDLTNNKIIDTGESINTNQDVFVSSIKNQVDKLVMDYLAANLVLNADAFPVAMTNVWAKNYADNSAMGINLTADANSAFDIKEGAGAAELEGYKIYHLNNLNNTDGYMWVVGHEDIYNNILQATLSYLTEHKADNTTSDYAPNGEHFPAMCIIQNDDKSGVIIGKKSATKFNEFARIFINSANEVEIVTPQMNGQSKFVIGPKGAKIKTTRFTVDGEFATTGAFHIGGNINTEGLRITENAVEAGVPDKPFTVVGSSIRIPGIEPKQNSTFLCVENGDIKVSPLSITEGIPGISNIPNNKKSLITSDYLYWFINSLIRDLNDAYFPIDDEDDGVITKLVGVIDGLHNSFTSTTESINRTLTNHDTRITTIENALSQQNSVNAVSGQSPQSNFVPGMVIDMWIDMPSDYNAAISQMFDSVTNHGKTNAHWNLFEQEKQSDLSAWRLCDGNNGTPNLIDISLVGNSNQSLFCLKLIYIG